jgi:hypothetical protein
MTHRENSLMLHGHSKQFRDPSTPARSPSSFAVGQDDRASRNMSRYPIVLKDYGIRSYFVPRVRYNKQALVYSGLLAGSAAFNCESAACGLKDRTQ